MARGTSSCSRQRKLNAVQQLGICCYILGRSEDFIVSTNHTHWKKGEGFVLSVLRIHWDNLWKDSVRHYSTSTTVLKMILLKGPQGLALLLSLSYLHSAHAFVPRSSPLEVRLRVDPSQDDLFRSTTATTSRQSSSRLFVAAPRKQSASRFGGGSKGKLKGTQAPPRFMPPTPHDENRGSKFRKLKDMMWIREAVEDLTAAEFACSVEASQERKRRRAVDYDKLLAQLNKRLRDLGCGVDDNDNSSVVCTLEPGLGMGTTVYNDEEREQLFE